MYYGLALHSKFHSTDGITHSTFNLIWLHLAQIGVMFLSPPMHTTTTALCAASDDCGELVMRANPCANTTRRRPGKCTCKSTRNKCTELSARLEWWDCILHTKWHASAKHGAFPLYLSHTQTYKYGMCIHGTIIIRHHSTCAVVHVLCIIGPRSRQSVLCLCVCVGRSQGF